MKEVREIWKFSIIDTYYLIRALFFYQKMEVGPDIIQGINTGGGRNPISRSLARNDPISRMKRSDLSQIRFDYF